MIMPNITKEEPDKYKKIFTNILHEAQNHWTELESYPAEKTARGALQRGNELVTAVLSFDSLEENVTLTARLPVNKEINFSTMRQVLRYQNHHRKRSAFLAVDDECNIASVWSKSSVQKDKLSQAVDCIFKDTCKLLEDEGLKELLN